MGESDNELEAILLDYVERYGLTSKARQYFGLRDLEEPGASEAKGTARDGRVLRDSLLMLRTRAEAMGGLASQDALRIAIMRVCLEFDIPTTLPLSDLEKGLKVMVPQTGDNSGMHFRAPAGTGGQVVWRQERRRPI